ncbi:serine hydrolase domain-containing protein [Mycobacteroides chelonae]|uniref:serine hydrolase domain-containing protein n=1 Tax=Mycobacteroides chelonae TaxID=1774 RepID=UPI001A9788E3|nr:serine hydrolase domain-containing protein [Mycobacteroides chelonae]
MSTLGLSVACASASSAGVTDTVDGVMQEHMAEFSIPGAAVGIVQSGRLVWSRGYGWANVKARTPMTSATIMNIASVSKTVTATAVMQLWERELIDLDANVNTYLPFDVFNPHYPAIPITARRLLNHLSSIRDGDIFWENNYYCRDAPVPLGEFLASLLVPGGAYYDADENFYGWPPGALKPEEDAYSNTGYSLLGYLVECRAGMSFAEYCAKFIFEPLQMSSTGWHLRDVDNTIHATLYNKVTEKTLESAQQSFASVLSAPGLSIDELALGSYMPLCFYSFASYPDGMLRTSVRDLSRFLSSYSARSGFQMLKESTIDLMLSSQSDGRALCWMKTVLKNGDEVWGHTGGDPGVSTYMGFRKKDGVGIMYFFNCEESGDDKLIEALFRTQQ